MKRKNLVSLFAFISLFIFISYADAQTSTFVYQGKLQDGALSANGNYQFEFKLYDAASGGNKIGQTLSDINATVSGGIFAVNLDFGADAFDGTARFLEISVRLNNTGQPYTTLNPRQPVTSTPYAVKSLKADEAVTATTASNSIRLGNVPASEYVQTTDTRMTDARNPLPFSGNYIQNGTTPQLTSNFNVSGEGKANIFNAATQYNLEGNRVLSVKGSSNLFVGTNNGTDNAGFNNTFVGEFSGQKNTTGELNAFFGTNAGQFNLSGVRNSFFGVSAGNKNISGAENAFFGINSGFSNTIGGSNSFYGAYSGRLTTEGSYNAFFGRSTGEANTTGGDNAFFGQASGLKNTTGSYSSALGSGAGINNTTGANNTFVGYLAGVSNTDENSNTFLGYKTNGAVGITNATAIGANAVVATSNTMVLGTNVVTVQVPGSLTVAGTFSANILNATTVYKINNNRVFHITGTDNTFVGFESGNSITTGNLNAFFGTYSGKGTTTGYNNAFFGSYAGRDNTEGNNNAFFGTNAGLSNKTGAGNSFFGSAAGFSNVSGVANSFYGAQSGESNTSGFNNSFFGRSAGKNIDIAGNSAFFGAFAGEKTTSGANSFFGALAGQKNVTGVGNTLLGFSAGNELISGNYNTFIGYQSGNSLLSGNNNIAVGYNNTFGAGVSNSTIIGANLTVTSSDETVIGGKVIKMGGNGFLGATAKVEMGDLSAGKLSAGDASVSSLKSFGDASFADGAVKITKSPNGFDNKLIVKGNIEGSDDASFQGTLTAQIIGSWFNVGGGSDEVCVSPQVQGQQMRYFAHCSSSLRYKDNIRTFTRGLELINKLRPVTFNWKVGGKLDVGFVAEEVNEAEPLLSTLNEQGIVEGVKYAQITTALVNAVKEQQTQIETQEAQNQKLQDQIKQQQTQIDALKAIVCAANPGAALCQQVKP